MKLSSDLKKDFVYKIEDLLTQLNSFKQYSLVKEVQYSLGVLKEKLAKADLDTIIELKDEWQNLGADINDFDIELKDVEEGIVVDETILQNLYAFNNSLGKAIEGFENGLEKNIELFLSLSEAEQLLVINDDLPHIGFLPYLKQMRPQAQSRLFERIAEKEHIEISDILIQTLSSYSALAKLIARKTQAPEMLSQLCLLKNEEVEEILINRDLDLWDYWGMLGSSGKRLLIKKIDSFETFLKIEPFLVFHTNTDDLTYIWDFLSKASFFEEITKYIKERPDRFKILKDRFPHLAL